MALCLLRRSISSLERNSSLFVNKQGILLLMFPFVFSLRVKLSIEPNSRNIEEVADVVFHAYQTVCCHKHVILVFLLDRIGVHHLKTADSVENSVN